MEIYSHRDSLAIYIFIASFAPNYNVAPLFALVPAVAVEMGGQQPRD